MAQFIGIEVSSVEKIYLALAELPQAIVEAGSDAVLDYWRGVLRNPANYPPYRFISRAEAYPNAPYKPGYFTKAQWVAVMIKIHKPGYGPGEENRTGKLAKGWQKVGSGERGFLYNAEPYASHVIGDKEQARQPALVGWLQSSDMLSQPRLVAGAERALKAEVEKQIKKRMPK